MDSLTCIAEARSIAIVIKSNCKFSNSKYRNLLIPVMVVHSGNDQELDEQSIKNVIGSLNSNGIGFYISNDAPAFQTWSLLNP